MSTVTLILPDYPVFGFSMLDFPREFLFIHVFQNDLGGTGTGYRCLWSPKVLSHSDLT